jgi:hypothetical protein
MAEVSGLPKRLYNPGALLFFVCIIDRGECGLRFEMNNDANLIMAAGGDSFPLQPGLDGSCITGRWDHNNGDGERKGQE